MEFWGCSRIRTRLDRIKNVYIRADIGIGLDITEKTGKNVTLLQIHNLMSREMANEVR